MILQSASAESERAVLFADYMCECSKLRYVGSLASPWHLERVGVLTTASICTIVSVVWGCADDGMLTVVGYGCCQYRLHVVQEAQIFPYRLRARDADGRGKKSTVW